jgi:hypothetical protein
VPVSQIFPGGGIIFGAQRLLNNVKSSRKRHTDRGGRGHLIFDRRGFALGEILESHGRALFCVVLLQVCAGGPRGKKFDTGISVCISAKYLQSSGETSYITPMYNWCKRCERRNGGNAKERPTASINAGL